MAHTENDRLRPYPDSGDSNNSIDLARLVPETTVNAAGAKEAVEEAHPQIKAWPGHPRTLGPLFAGGTVLGFLGDIIGVALSLLFVGAYMHS